MPEREGSQRWDDPLLMARDRLKRDLLVWRSRENGYDRGEVGCTAVLLDPHPLWLDAVADVVGRIGVHVVGMSTSPETALALIDEFDPDLFIAGIEATDGEMDGIECIATARKRRPRIKPIVLSMYDDPESINRALFAGALVYIVKTAHPDDLAAAVRQVFQHSIYLPDSRMQDPAPAREVRRLEPVPHLTRRELEILRLVAVGLPNAEVAKLLWVTEQTVKFHLSNIYRKLGVANRTEASRWAQIHGLLPSGAVSATA
jgi:DNA-binding NarL/FixJ family response regulator